MANYKLKEGFTHYENGPHNRTPAGTIVSMSDKRYNSLRDRFEPVVEDLEVPEEIKAPSDNETETLSSTDPVDEDGDSEDLDDWINEIASMNAKDARATVAIIEDVEVLIALLAVESRSTVVTALDERLEEIS